MDQRITLVDILVVRHVQGHDEPRNLRRDGDDPTIGIGVVRAHRVEVRIPVVQPAKDKNDQDERADDEDGWPAPSVRVRICNHIPLRRAFDSGLAIRGGRFGRKRSRACRGGRLCDVRDCLPAGRCPVDWPSPPPGSAPPPLSPCTLLGSGSAGTIELVISACDMARLSDANSLETRRSRCSRPPNPITGVPLHFGATVVCRVDPLHPTYVRADKALV